MIARPPRLLVIEMAGVAKAGRPHSSTSNIARRRQNARAEGSDDYAQRRAELVAIAAALFKEQGYEATTLAHVGERAGLDRATVYYYVGSKQELFQTSIEGILDELLATSERLRLDKDLGVRDKLRGIISAVMKSHATNYPQMFVFLQEQLHQIRNDPSPWAKEIQRKTRRLEAIVRELVEQGVEQGKLRSDIDVRVAVRGLFGMLNWTHRWYTPSSATTADKIAETFTKIFLEGMQRPR